MAIWRKKKERDVEEKSSKEKSSKSNSCLANLHKADEGQVKSKATEVEVSLKSSRIIPDLNKSYAEGYAEILLLSKRRFDINEGAATMNIHKLYTHLPSVLIVKACKACHIYVMVKEDDQRCPRCRVGTHLFDVCDDFHANKKRLI